MELFTCQESVMIGVDSDRLIAPSTEGLVSPEAADESAGLSVSLSSLQRGQRARIVSLSADATFYRRLLDLGFVPGSQVIVRQKAPLQDPVEYEVRGSRICLRRADSQHILVSVIQTPTS